MTFNKKITLASLLILNTFLMSCDTNLKVMSPPKNTNLDYQKNDSDIIDVAKIKGTKANGNKFSVVLDLGKIFNTKTTSNGIPSKTKNDVKSYQVNLCTDPTQPDTTQVLPPSTFVNRDSSQLIGGKHIFTFLNVAPSSTPYYATIQAFDQVNLSGNSILKDDNGGTIYSGGDTGKKIAVSTNNLIVNPDFSIIFNDSPNNKLDIVAHLIDSSPPTIDSNIYPDKGLLGSFALNDLKVDQGAGGTSQTNPSSFINNNGNGLVVWRDTRASTISLYARFFNDYLPDGNDFSITTKSNSSGDIFNSNVNLTNSGNGFIVWAESIPDPVTYASHIYLQQMKSYIPFSNKVPIDGSLIGNQQNQSQPKVSLSSSGGRGAIVWHGDSDPTIAVNNDIYISSLTSSNNWSSYKLGGSSATPTTIINSSLPFDQTDASISKINISGVCFVVWQDNRSGNYDIYGRKVNIGDTGTIGFDTETIINQGTTNNQEKPSIALDDNGNGLIVWQDSRSVNYNIYGRKVSGYSLSTSDPEFIISNASGDKKLPNVKLDSNGNGIVTWDDAGTSRTPAVSGTDIYAKKIKAYTPIGNDYKVDNDTTLAQSNNSLSMNDSGNGFISWQDLRDNSDVNIYGRRIINNKTQ